MLVHAVISMQRQGYSASAMAGVLQQLQINIFGDLATLRKAFEVIAVFFLCGGSNLFF